MNESAKEADAVNRIAASPCCKPDLDLNEVPQTYSARGFRRFVVFESYKTMVLYEAIKESANTQSIVPIRYEVI